MPFSKIKGHHNVIKQLERAHTYNRIPSAYLFVGPDGIGKTSIVLEFARLINCDEMPPCGKCNNCKLFAGSSHPDLIIIKPIKQYIEINTIRTLIGSLSLKPAFAKKRIVIVKHAHRMRAESANSFLKILEEPPLNTLIIVMTPDDDLLLETIRSRCQSLSFAPLQQEILKNIILTHYSLDQADFDFALNFSQGRIRKDFLKKVSLLNTMRSQTFTIISNLTSNRMMDHVYLLEQWIKQENYTYFLEFFSSYIRDLLLLQENAQKMIQNRDMIPDLESFATKVNKEQLMSVFSLITETEIAIKSNAAKLLALEGLLVQIKQIFNHSVIV